jgi:hypothetical protein
MRTIRFRACILFVVHAGIYISPASAQVSQHQITDFVELPAELNLRGDTACFMEFRERWSFPGKGLLIKEILGYELACSGEQKDLRLSAGTLRIKDYSYEFILLDPHLVESGNRAFSESDSMDLYAKKLQSDLIELIQALAPFNPRYEPRKQLLSVYFHEEWTIGPDSRQISKRIKGITPVIWQRRQTTEGRSIDEGDSGLPVYYKTPLQKVSLRFP